MAILCYHVAIRYTVYLLNSEEEIVMLKYLRKISLSIVLKAIENFDDPQLNEIIQAVIRRYQTLFPDWDVMFLSLSRNPEERRKQLDLTVDFLNRHIQ